MGSKSCCFLLLSVHTLGLVIEELSFFVFAGQKASNLPQDDYDTNLYMLCRIGEHNVVVACLPAG
jgi:hypothetical protein